MPSYKNIGVQWQFDLIGQLTFHNEQMYQVYISILDCTLGHILWSVAVQKWARVGTNRADEG